MREKLSLVPEFVTLEQLAEKYCQIPQIVNENFMTGDFVLNELKRRRLKPPDLVVRATDKQKILEVLWMGSDRTPDWQESIIHINPINDPANKGFSDKHLWIMKEKHLRGIEVMHGLKLPEKRPASFVGDVFDPTHDILSVYNAQYLELLAKPNFWKINGCPADCLVAVFGLDILTMNGKK